MKNSTTSAPAPRGAVVIDMGIYRARRILKASTTLHRLATCTPSERAAGYVALTARERVSLNAALDSLDIVGCCACWTWPMPGRRCIAASVARV